MADFSLNACYESVVFEVETLKVNVFEALGRAIIRAEQDVFYNKTMIEAYKKYISDHNIKWNEQFNSNRAGAVTPAESEEDMTKRLLEKIKINNMAVYNHIELLKEQYKTRKAKLAEIRGFITALWLTNFVSEVESRLLFCYITL